VVVVLLLAMFKLLPEPIKTLQENKRKGLNA
jgi:hypothetical protein